MRFPLVLKFKAVSRQELQTLTTPQNSLGRLLRESDFCQQSQLLPGNARLQQSYDCFYSSLSSLL